MKKYPDDFLKYRTGPSVQGRSDQHVLAGTDAPFLTRRMGGTVTRKKDRFMETRTVAGEPTVALWHSGPSGVWLAFVDIAEGRSLNRLPFTRFPELPGATLFSGRLKLLGAGLMGAIFSDSAAHPGAELTGDVVCWPCLLDTRGGIKQRLLTEPAELGRTVTYVDSLQITGRPAYSHAPEWHGSGWDDAVGAYRIGVAFTYWTDPDDKLASGAPVFYGGDSESLALTSKAIPYYPGRDQPNFSVFVIGPGLLQSLVTVAEDPDLPLLLPYMLTSSDHGDTWTASTTGWLTPYLEVIPAGSEPRDYLNTVQLYGISKHHINTYVGDGKNILIIHNGVDSYTGSTPNYRAMAFLGSAGAGYTRLSWPPDTWAVDQSGQAGVPPFVIGPFADRDHLDGHLSFGEGCMYVPVTYTGANLLVTYDFGSNWEVKSWPALPDGMTGGTLSLSGAVLRPYESPAQPGQILMTYRNTTTGRIDFLVCDGLFTTLRKTAGVAKAGGALTADPIQTFDPVGIYNQYPTNYAGPVFPAFPGEFDKP